MGPEGRGGGSFTRTEETPPPPVDAEDLDLPDTLPAANALDDGLELGAEAGPHEPPPTGPLPAGDPHASRLAALIADATLEEVNAGKTMNVAVFLDSERLSAEGGLAIGPSRSSSSRRSSPSTQCPVPSRPQMPRELGLKLPTSCHMWPGRPSAW